jgi:hypothetical protein
MSNEISLSELIEKVKSDLFTSVQGKENQGKIVYPLFFVEQVELELDVDIAFEASAGIKISIPQLAEGSVSGAQAKTSGHKMKVVLAPILTRDEMRGLIDDRQMAGIRQAAAVSLRKGE